MTALRWCALALVLGALPAFAFPAPSLWWLAWFALVPLLLVVRAAPSSLQGALRAWCGLAGFVLTTQYWLWPFAGPLLPLMAALFGALWLPWGWAAHRLLSRPVTSHRTLTAVVVLPSAWVVAETVRSWPSLGGPWALLGASQWNQPATLASASLGGVWLTSFLIVAANTALAAAILQWRSPAFALATAAACVLVGPAWFWLSPQPPNGETGRVALVQPGNIEDGTARQAAGEALTATLEGQRLDLVVWGESSVAVDLATDTQAARRLADLSRRVGADLLVNVDARAPTGGIYKSSVLVGPDGPRGSYAKTRLVPFGEYVPMRQLIEWATRRTEAADEDRRRGTDQVVLHTNSLAIGPLISFETTFSDLPRRVVQLGSDLLAYQSSTSSFQGSWAQPQLASQAAVHAVEVGRPAVHATLSGVSAAFDARGRKLAWLPATEQGVVVVDVSLASQNTVYQRLGPWVPALAVAVLAVAVVVTVRRGVGSGRGVHD
ncbi:apolipoprotein N-acyltransferase [Mycobacterium hubeiense]|uniref:apolipoprotein N-acyltransferase n=1 Tax=Mycobacterium hubeiense TaxID=1867256 RepID=UPI000C7F278B|nr:apolipoprotein N-acyltransferase [Mycobacterium sp. QGD 101]